MPSTVSVIAEYIWVDGFGNLRSKSKVLPNSQSPFPELPTWNYDGSSTGQAPGSDSEVILRPCVTVPDPFRGHPHVLVMCDTWNPDGSPHRTNTREPAVRMFNRASELEPRFGIEQEFFLSKRDPETGKVLPISFFGGKLSSQRDYYCGVGADNIWGRECIEEAFIKCLDAGLSLTGLNAEVAPAQWEFQVCTDGISAGDQLYLARYIIGRVAEKYCCNLDLRPKPVEGDWNGSGCHTNYSTRPMREEGGYGHIMAAIKRLEAKHDEHMAVYGKDNDKRMTGKHETASFETFSYGVANRGASVRIPCDVEKRGRGYFEDRRPASNMDPYVVTSKIFETTCFPSSSVE